jgi:hypothetical protein
MPGAKARSIAARELDSEEPARIAACPRCGASLALAHRRDAGCQACGSHYPALPHGWDVRPSGDVLDSPKWEPWDVVQTNGVVGFTEDPELLILASEDIPINKYRSKHFFKAVQAA